MKNISTKIIYEKMNILSFLKIIKRLIPLTFQYNNYANKIVSPALCVFHDVTYNGAWNWHRESSTSGDDSPTGPRHNLYTLPAANRGGQGWSSIHDNSHPQRDPRHIEAANYYLDKSIKPRFTRDYVTL